MTERAILFDMDGVLVDSERYWVEADAEHIFPAAGVPETSIEETTGLNYHETYEYLDGEYDTDIDREEFVALNEEIAEEIYADRVALMDGFRDLCGTLRDRGVALAVVSSSPRAWIEAVLDRFDLTGFDAIVSAEDLSEPGKPEPHIYRHAASDLGVDPENCVAVEDSTNGIEAATRAGMGCIGYRNTTDEDLDQSAADATVSGPRELRAELLA